MLTLTENKLLKQEQKYLIEENKYIQKIYELNALLKDKEDDEVKWQ